MSTDEVLRYNFATADFEVFITVGSGGLNNPWELAFGPDGDLYIVSGSTSLHYDGQTGEFVGVFADGISSPLGITFGPDGNLYLTGQGTIDRYIGPFTPSTFEDLVVTVGAPLPPPPPPSKFYVVDDGATDRTYEYASPGTAVENYAINSANTAPRGAASTAAGDKVWVVDNNRKVYVYNPSGALLGSWTAGTLASNATPQGIATNGTDVWIVDSKSDKVFRYTGAATRLSGNQNAASSFSLNSGNTSPTDIVTDGTSLWVTNDAAANTVFKYNLGGAYWEAGPSIRRMPRPRALRSIPAM